MANYSSADVKCPFFRHDDPRTSGLTCEGVLPGSTVKSHFPGKSELQEHRRKFCSEDYRSCPWFRAVYTKYADL